MMTPMTQLEHQLSFGVTEGIEDEEYMEQLEHHASLDVQDRVEHHGRSYLAIEKEHFSFGDDFQIGDHVFTWSNLLQRHGIVVDIFDDGMLMIADFSLPPIGETDEKAEVVCFQLQQDCTQTTKWRKVLYGATKLQRAMKQPGTCSCDIPDHGETVLERFNFLMLHYHLIPKVGSVYSNSETLASWCCTGQWRALQLGRWIDISSTASVVGSGSVASIAVAEGVGASAGIHMCGLLGAEMAMAAPIILPVVAVGSLVAGGVAVWNTNRVRKEWNRISDELNREFERIQKRSLKEIRK